jgi:glucan phosphoethanolaminetransferase (alkaline phosphatase superfamily)
LGFLNGKLFLYMVFLGFLPSTILIGFIQLRPETQQYRYNLQLGLITLIFLLLILYSGLYLRNYYRFIKLKNRHTINYVPPINYTASLIRPWGFTNLKDSSYTNAFPGYYSRSSDAPNNYS